MNLLHAPRVWRCLPAALVLILAAGCARSPWIEDQPSQQGDDVVIRAAGAGRHRFTLLRSPQSPPPTALTCQNNGAGPVENVQLWGLGGKDLVDLQPESGQAPEPFRLLPSERLSLSASGGGDTGRPPLLTGSFGWQWPPQSGIKTPWPGVLAGATIDDDGSVRFLGAPGMESRAELFLDSPIPIQTLRVGWAGAESRVPPASPVDVWIGDDQGRWIRVARPATVDLRQPFEIPAAAGRKSFRLRFSWSQGTGGPTPPQLNRIRIEREFQAPGSFRLLPAGASEIRFAFGGGAADPDAAVMDALELHLLALPAL